MPWKWQNATDTALAGVAHQSAISPNRGDHPRANPVIQRDEQRRRSGRAARAYARPRRHPVALRVEARLLDMGGLPFGHTPDPGTGDLTALSTETVALFGLSAGITRGCNYRKATAALVVA